MFLFTCIFLNCSKVSFSKKYLGLYLVSAIVFGHGEINYSLGNEKRGYHTKKQIVESETVDDLEYNIILANGSKVI